MAKFLSGFAAATGLWLAVAAGLVVGLGWGPPVEEVVEEELEVAPLTDTDTEPTEPTKRGRRRSRRGGNEDTPSGARTSTPRGEASTGDDLREGEMRTIDGEGTGGEAQLSNRQIETAFDGAMPRIRRCFVLAAGDDPVSGRLTFGLRIRGSGEVSAVNLTGPAAVTTGDCGECLRTAVRGIRFPSFDGPEMLARFPITLE